MDEHTISFSGYPHSFVHNFNLLTPKHVQNMRKTKRHGAKPVHRQDILTTFPQQSLENSSRKKAKSKTLDFQLFKKTPRFTQPQAHTCAHVLHNKTTYKHTHLHVHNNRRNKRPSV